MTERSYLGRGLDDIPGKPFGWAWYEERAEIRAHLRRRIWRFGLDPLRAFRLEQRIDAIQRRIHRTRPSLRERQAAARAARPAPTGENLFLTFEEIERLAELFADANDPLTASIGAKAAARISGGEA